MDDTGGSKMASWEVTALLLFVLGLLKEFKPSEPFFMEYAVDHRQHPADYMLHSILPITTYAGLFSLLIILCITDFLHYKPVIILCAFCSILSWVIVIWAYEDSPYLEIRQIIEAISISSEVAYFTYMYANVEHSKYMMVTSVSHGALHTGRFFGSLTGQLLISRAGMNVYHLNYVTLGGVSLGFLVALRLPKAKRAIYFRSRKSVVAGLGLDGISSGNLGSEATVTARIRRALHVFWQDMWTAYSNRYILRWSLWWSIATSIFLQVGLYAEPLWRHIEEETHQKVYNGYVDATQALLSAILGMSVVYLKIPWMKMGELYLTGISFLQGGALILMSQAHSLYWNYVGYISYQTCFQTMIIVVTSEVAEGVNESSEAFIFGLNTAFALLLQTMLTVAVTSEYGFVLDIREEFLVYGACSLLLGVVFFAIALQSHRKFFKLERVPSPDNKHDNINTVVHTESFKPRNSSLVSINW